MLAWLVPDLAVWARALGARSIAEAGLLPIVEPRLRQLLVGIDPSFRLPVLIAYLALVIVTAFWPRRRTSAS